MEDETLAFLERGTEEAGATNPEPTAVIADERSEERAGEAPALRDEPAGRDGAAVGDEPAVRDDPVAPVRPGHVPIAAMLDERDKRQALERKLADIEAAQRASQAQAELAQAPADAQQAAQLWAIRRDLSREMAATRHGESEAQALEAWGFERCEADPHFNSQVYQSRNPYEFLRQARQREQLLAEVRPEDLEEYRAWKSTRDSPGPAPSTPSGSSSPASGGGTNAPRSLATAPNAGVAGARTEVPIGPGAAFNQTIRR